MRPVILLLFLSCLSPLLPAQEVETRLVVRARSKDAKFIGSSVGGAWVLVRDAHSGKLLAEGPITGSTGNTARIMEQPRERYSQLADAETAGFRTSLRLQKPLFVTVELLAPYNQPGARVQAQTQLWLLPGRHIEGDGLVLEVPGFIVNVLAPQTHETIALGKPLPLTANVVMMCGCPISPGGLWDARGYQVEALVYQADKLLQRIPLQATQKTSTFAGDFTPQAAGLYEVIITAYDAKTGNTGVDKVNFIIQ
ncbi:hypothetical protein [Cesiribacter andamanensis]|uniref:Uncharacterized protein n=1 Tax=Cesiribacter andamanensis AMV16 TaxID=1279009 RepID=M7N2M6_9BACT|nr:hypothetical protein [Cesiribacter andamanensis]EMR01471.1 hypothetical protein ADICEAN_03402 [Cesiribacter andamanensis AMV16]